MKLLSLLLMAGTLLVAQTTAQGRGILRPGHPSLRALQSVDGAHRLQLLGHPGLHLRVGTRFYRGYGRRFSHRYYRYYPQRRQYPYRGHYAPRRYYRRRF